MNGNQVQTAALAGSRPRHEHPGADARLRAELLASPKERHEHDIVVKDIKESLTTAGVRLDSLSPAGVMKLRRIQHLHTPISGLVPDDKDILDLVRALHPTPPSPGYQGKPLKIGLMRMNPWIGAGMQHLWVG